MVYKDLRETADRDLSKICDHSVRVAGQVEAQPAKPIGPTAFSVWSGRTTLLEMWVDVLHDPPSPPPVSASVILMAPF